jgi:hypothetical protein
VGPVLGAYVEGMYYLGKAIYAPLQNAFASIGLGEPADAPPCATHGDPMTPERIVTIQKQGLPATPKGSFAELMVGALAMYASNEANCKGGIAPQDLVDAVVKLWNQGHKGPAKPYFIPPLSNGGTGLARAIIPNAPPDSHSTTPAAKAGKDPNVYYAFGPASSLSHYLGNPSLTDSSKWKAPPFPVNEPPVGGMFASNYTYTPPRLVQVNTGAAIPPAAPAPAPAPAAAPAAAPPKPFDLSGFASAKVVPAAKSKLSVIVGGTGLLSAAAALLAGQPVLAFVIATSSVAGAYELKKRGR